MANELLTAFIDAKVAETDSLIAKNKDDFEKFKMRYFKSNEAEAKILRLKYSELFKINANVDRHKRFVADCEIRLLLCEKARNIFSLGLDDLGMRGMLPLNCACGFSNESGSFHCGKCGKPLSWMLEKVESARKNFNLTVGLLDEYENVLEKRDNLPAWLFKGKFDDLRLQLKLLREPLLKLVTSAFCNTTVFSGIQPSSSDLEGDVEVED